MGQDTQSPFISWVSVVVEQIFLHSKKPVFLVKVLLQLQSSLFVASIVELALHTQAPFTLLNQASHAHTPLVLDFPSPKHSQTLVTVFLIESPVHLGEHIVTPLTVTKSFLFVILQQTNVLGFLDSCSVHFIKHFSPPSTFTTSLMVRSQVEQTLVTGSSLNPFLQRQFPFIFSRKGSMQTHCPCDVFDLPEITITGDEQTQVSSNLVEYEGHAGIHPADPKKYNEVGHCPGQSASVDLHVFLSGH